MTLDPFTAGLDFAKTAIDKIWPDATEEQRDKINLILKTREQQYDLNRLAAQNPSVFVSGARSFVLWAFGAAFAWNFVVGPILVFGLSLFGVDAKLPGPDIVLLSKTLLALLGVGA